MLTAIVMFYANRVLECLIAVKAWRVLQKITVVDHIVVGYNYPLRSSLLTSSYL